MITMAPPVRWLGVLALLGVLCPPSLASAQSRREIRAERGTMIGRVLDAQHHVLVGAELSVSLRDSIVRRARSDSDGTFEFSELDVGSYVVVARRLGFKARRVDVNLARSQPTRLDVVLTAMPATLEEVRVEARIDESKGKLREFYEHRARSQFGYFFGPENLEPDKMRYTSEIVRRVPGARLLPARFGHRVQFRGCSPLVVIDGQRVAGAELDEVTDPDDIAAIEIYPSMAGLPPQYVGYDSRCGVIVVWTRVS
jgi:carboxypeptidase family protein